MPAAMLPAPLAPPCMLPPAAAAHEHYRTRLCGPYVRAPRASHLTLRCLASHAISCRCLRVSPAI
jgi:hypothetical protein